MFSESLKIELRLQINGTSYFIPGGNIKSCDLTLNSYGFHGRVGFGLFSDSSRDTLFPSFITQDLIKVAISLTCIYYNREETSEPVLLNALVTGKSVRESFFKEVKEAPVLQRDYEISFKDVPSVLWEQHFPMELYTDVKLSDVINKQIVEGITVKVDESFKDRVRKMIFLGLHKHVKGSFFYGSSYYGPSYNGPSFYDFLIWYVHSSNSVLTYDYGLSKIILSATKFSGDIQYLVRPGEVVDLGIIFPETIRHNTRILNVHSEEHTKIDVSQNQSVSGITKDIIARTAIRKELDEIKTLETGKLKPDMYSLDITMNSFPEKRFTPGAVVKFEKEHWTKNILIMDKKFRIFEVRMNAKTKNRNLSDNYQAEFGKFDMEMSIKMELEDNPTVSLPAYIPPRYPVYVEGKIVSEQPGDESDKTYQIYTDEDTSKENYKIYVPLWDKYIYAPFIPGIFTGHFYFPAFKNARVLLALYYDRARIAEFLDWGDGARLPMDTQGNHLLFGKNDSSKTSMQYLYEENKPVFSIKRSSSTDTELIRMEEESIILQTRDE